MRKILALLGALLLAVVLLAFNPSPADAEQTLHETPHGVDSDTRLGVRANSTRIDGNTIRTNWIELFCANACGPAGQLRFRNIDIIVRGSGGTTFWRRDNVDVPSGEVLRLTVNKQHGNGADWEIITGKLVVPDNPYHLFGDCWPILPGGASPHNACYYFH